MEPIDNGGSSATSKLSMADDPPGSSALTGWNYRVCRCTDHDGSDYFMICEVYYEDHKPTLYGPSIVGGESVRDLRSNLEWMMVAIDKSVLEYPNYADGDK